MQYKLLDKPQLLALKILPLLFLICSSTVFGTEFIVKVKNNPLKHDLASLSIRSNNKIFVSDVSEKLKFIKVTSKEATDNKDIATELKKYFNARYVVKNSKLHAIYGEDPKRSQQWALDMVNADLAYDISEGSSSVIVAVLDTGIDLEHEDLVDNLWKNEDEIEGNQKDDDNNGYIDDYDGWDFHGKDNDPTDKTSFLNPGHGTHCSGIIGASCGNGKGICGMSPIVSIMPLRFLNEFGSGDLFASIKAIEYAVENGAHIISASFGASISEEEAKPIIEAIEYAEEHGVIFVAAAANDGKSNDKTDIYPANAQTPHMISVAASNSNDEKPSWSNFGRKVDIAAPGDKIISTIPDGYSELSGTSMATPLVAGLVALMKSLDADLKGDAARSILQSTGVEVNIETESMRRVDAHAALKAVKDRQLTVVPAAATIKPGGSLDFSAWGGLPPYSFSSSDPNVATISESGNLQAVAKGEVIIQVSDSNGDIAESVSVVVAEPPPPENGGDCPFPDENICKIACKLLPSLPFCK